MPLQRLGFFLRRPNLRIDRISKKTIRFSHCPPAIQGYKPPSQPCRNCVQPPLSALINRAHLPIMAPRPALEKQYMSTKPAKQIAEPRPSACILLISPTNEILLLHRVRTSSSFPSAHVFPGGNLSAQDGDIPEPKSEGRHVDGKAYRGGAIRECFEESGILLAKKKDGSDALLEVEEEIREKGRKEVHSGKITFGEWVKQQGGVIDTDGLIPFTRWITPTNLPKRFTTQMYLYFLPLTQPTSSLTPSSAIPVPTSDGGLEHTAALFAPCQTWLSQARANEIILFPPQFYLMHLLAPFLTTPLSSTQPLSREELQQQREQVLEFLKGDGGDGKGIAWADKVMSPIGLLMRKGDGGDGKGIAWADKVMSPIGLLMRKGDGRSVLGLDKPGPELKESGRGGDWERVVLVRFKKEGPRDVEVLGRREVLEEEKRMVEGNGAKL